MRRRSWAALASSSCGVIVLAWSLLNSPMAKATGDNAKKPATRDVFGLTKVLQFDLKLSAKDYARMQPAQGMGFGHRASAPPARKDRIRPTSRPMRTRAASAWSSLGRGPISPKTARRTRMSVST